MHLHSKEVNRESGSAAQLDDGQVLSVLDVAHDKPALIATRSVATWVRPFEVDDDRLHGHGHTNRRL